jgi:N-hydroxyarylamine O-acetyltransferase
MTFEPDLDAYFDRIGYRGSRAPTRDVLNEIVRAHIQTIPFENLDVLLGRGIDLDPAAVERKLVHTQRGGYCFEQNSHLLRVLHAMGYDAVTLSARVRVQRPRDFTPPRTHVFVRVMFDGRPWLADVGVGALSPTATLRLDVDHEQPTPHEPRRIIAEGEWGAAHTRYFHQVRLGDAWQDVCELTGEVMPEIDREVANWFTSTHPRSHFRDRLIVARATPTGRVTLVNRELTVRDSSGATQTHTVDSPQELLEVLARHFDMHFERGTVFSCAGLDW